MAYSNFNSPTLAAPQPHAFIAPASSSILTRSFTNKKKKSTHAVRRVLEEWEDLSNPLGKM